MVYPTSITSIKLPKRVFKSLDPFFIPVGGSVTLLYDAARGARKPGGRCIQKKRVVATRYRQNGRIFTV